MSDFYDLVSQDSAPVSLADMRNYLKIPASVTTDDALITALIDAATEYGEKYTGRSFRVQTFNLLLDEFSSRICLRRSPVDAITHVKHLVSDVQVTVATTVYYLKIRQQWSEILLADGEEWPDDTDEREQAIEIQFTTTKYAKADSLIDAAIMRHVAYIYMNRGECEDCSGANNIYDAGAKSGANALYNTFRISRV
jgi:uncharacterized phiE125 gp8 family phage protein